MPHSIKACLLDIRKAILEVEVFLPNRHDFLEFQSDLKTQRAIERNIEIIGEAVNRILKIDGDYKISNAKRIISTRNRVIHGYDTISLDVIWGIVIRELPLLKEEIVKLIEETEN